MRSVCDVKLAIRDARLSVCACVQPVVFVFVRVPGRVRQRQSKSVCPYGMYVPQLINDACRAAASRPGRAMAVFRL